MKAIRRILMTLATAVGVWGTAVHGQTVQNRLVFAHYMVTNGDYQNDSDPSQEAKIAAYEREIQQAQAVGIDGFALNVGGWLREPYYIRYTAQMFEAAVRLHSGFKLMFSADMCCGNRAEDVEDMMRRFAGNPHYSAVYFHKDGRAVLTTFAGDKLGTSGWQAIRNELLTGTHPSTTMEPAVLAPAAATPSNAPLAIFFVPAFFWGGELPSNEALRQGMSEWSSTIDGAFYWGIAGVPGSGGSLDQTRSSAAEGSALYEAGKLYMAPVCLQFWGANANRYYEYSGMAGMRKMWQSAIQSSHADWVEIITWNDFIEGTYVSPIDDPNRYPGANHLDASHIPSSTLNYFHTHAGAYDLLPYFIQWYKSGKPPAIKADELFYSYRTQPLHVDAALPPAEHLYGPAADMVYVTLQLTRPADLVVTSGNHITRIAVAAGSSDVQAPFAAGNPPHFTVLRHGQAVIDGYGNQPIDAHPKYRDLYYTTGRLRAINSRAANVNQP